MKWDPQRYSQYATERERPLRELVNRIDCPAPRRVIDLGCGPGTTTVWLQSLWPVAEVSGIDSAPEMIAAAQQLSAPGISFTVGDAAQWTVPADADVIVSNAVLQWIPGHDELLRRWAAELPSGAWLAFQVPGNFGAPSHTLMRQVAASPRWRAQLDGVLRGDNWVWTGQEYAQLLLDAGLSVDAWETTYLHVLPGDDPVLEWVRGTGLRPVLAALSRDEAAEYEAEYARLLRDAYPATEHGTVFPFRRIFVVAHRA